MQQPGALQQHRLVVDRMTLTLRVGDIATRVVCEEPGATLAVPDPVSRFLVPDGPADATIHVKRTTGLADPAGEKLFDSGLVWRLYRAEGDFVFSFTSTARGPAPYRIARFDPTFTTGHVWLDDDHATDGEALDPLQYPLDELLMINLLARGRGVEVHACGVVDRDGAGLLFAGQSGAGKSTIAHVWHSAGATVLSDDRVILRVRDDRVWMYGTPWHGDGNFASPGAAPLARIFFLEHGPRNRARPVLDAAAVARLLACSFLPFHDQVALDFTLALLSRVVDRVPSAELAFVPDAGVARFVRGRA